MYSKLNEKIDGVMKMTEIIMERNEQDYIKDVLSRTKPIKKMRKKRMKSSMQKTREYMMPPLPNAVANLSVPSRKGDIPLTGSDECSSLFSQGSAMVRHRKPLKRILLSSPDEISLSSEDTNLMMNIQVKKMSTCMREKKNSQVELKKAGKKVKPNASVNTSIYANHNSFGKNTVATLSCM